MDTLTIVFAGLIAHVLTVGGVQRAVIVAAPNHAARLIVRSSDVVSESGPPLAEDTGAPAGERWFNIAGSTIKFAGLPAGTPVVDSSFVENVVPLSMISDATETTPEIDAGRLFSGAVAYVDLPMGLLSARDLYPHQVIFDGSRWSGPKCLAQHVVFTSGAAGNSATQIRVSNGATVTVRAGAVLRIENEPTISMAPHFNMYEQLLVGASAFFLPSMTSGSCAFGPLTASASAHGVVAGLLNVQPHGVRTLEIGTVECTNSHFP